MPLAELCGLVSVIKKVAISVCVTFFRTLLIVRLYSALQVLVQSVNLVLECRKRDNSAMVKLNLYSSRFTVPTFTLPGAGNVS